MKKLLLFILCLFTFMTYAQTPNQEKPVLTAEQKAKMEVKRMTADLDLTAEQQQRIEKMLIDNNRKTGDIKLRLQTAKPDENQALKIEYIESLKALKTNMKAILTQEQQDKWDAIYKQRFQKQPQNTASPGKP